MATKGQVLAAHGVAQSRLQLQEQVYGASSKRLLQQAGVQPGMRIAGAGDVPLWLVEQISEDAIATDLNDLTRLPRGSFDVIFCRFLLCRVERPEDALQEMKCALRPGGLLVAQEFDFQSLFSEPANCAYQRSVELMLALGDIRGVDYSFGLRLDRAVSEAGFAASQAMVEQPQFSDGAGKRLWQYTFVQEAPAMVAASLVQQREIDQLVEELAGAALDENTVLAAWKVFGVYGRERIETPGDILSPA